MINTSIPLSFDSLMKANMARQKEWDKNSAVTIEYRANELGGEVGEAFDEMLLLVSASGRVQNLAKKLARERNGMVGSRANSEAIKAELCDVVICASLMAMHLQFDLGEAVKAKFNKTSEKNGLKTRLA